METQVRRLSANCFHWPNFYMGFPDSSIGKESACKAGDPGWIPGLGGFTEEGIGYPLQYSWASLAAQLVKNLPTMQETWVQSLGWEDPLETGKATHSSILTWRSPWTVQSLVLQRVGHDGETFTFTSTSTWMSNHFQQSVAHWYGSQYFLQNRSKGETVRISVYISTSSLYIL